MEDKCFTTRKVQLIPVGDKEEINRVYKHLCDGMVAQNKAMNEIISGLYLAQKLDMTKEDQKEFNRFLSRVSSNKKGSAITSDIEFATGLKTSATANQKANKDFKVALKKGVMYGNVSLPNYKKDGALLIDPVFVRLRSINQNSDTTHLNAGMYHNYKDRDDFLKHLYRSDLSVYIKFPNDITFKIVFGSPKKSAELRSVFKNIFDEYYEVRGSKIEIKDNKIILNLSFEIPKENVALDENVVVGVDLGIAVPAVCALNTNEYCKLFIGSKEDSIDVKTKIKNQRSRLQKSITFNSGGHGRKKKLKPLDRFDGYESNWQKTYNHKVSKMVVDFAVKNKAKYINLEDLSGITDKDEEHRRNKILRSWTFYQLQEMITYKAARYGIVVRKVKPYYTSQTCSCCGHLEDGQRVSQASFVCKNPECKNFGKDINADFNAARNISMSTEFVTEEDKKNKRRKQKAA